MFVETRRAFQLPRTGSALFYVCSGLNSSFFSVYDSNGTLDAIFSVLGKQCPSATRNMPTASAVEQFFFPPPSSTDYSTNIPDPFPPLFAEPAPTPPPRAGRGGEGEPVGRLSAGRRRRGCCAAIKGGHGGRGGVRVSVSVAGEAAARCARLWLS